MPNVLCLLGKLEIKPYGQNERHSGDGALKQGRKGLE